MAKKRKAAKSTAPPDDDGEGKPKINNKKRGNDKQRQLPTSTIRNNMTTSSRHKSQQKNRRRRGGDGVQRIPTPDLGWPFTTTTTTTTTTKTTATRTFFLSQNLSQCSGFSSEFPDRKDKAADAPLTFSQTMNYAKELKSRHGPPSSPLPDEGVSTLRMGDKLDKKVKDIPIVHPKPQSMSLSTAHSGSVVLSLKNKNSSNNSCKLLLLPPNATAIVRPEWNAYPMEGITEPHKNDVICGGPWNYSGNYSFLELVNNVKSDYLRCPKGDEKAAFVMRIVQSVRAQSPPGRFLQHDKSTKSWKDIGDKKACEKTLQTLRRVSA